MPGEYPRRPGCASPLWGGSSGTGPQRRRPRLEKRKKTGTSRRILRTCPLHTSPGCRYELGEEVPLVPLQTFETTGGLPGPPPGAALNARSLLVGTCPDLQKRPAGTGGSASLFVRAPPLSFRIPSGGLPTRPWRGRVAWPVHRSSWSLGSSCASSSNPPSDLLAGVHFPAMALLSSSSPQRIRRPAIVFGSCSRSLRLLGSSHIRFIPLGPCRADPFAAALTEIPLSNIPPPGSVPSPAQALLWFSRRSSSTRTRGHFQGFDPGRVAPSSWN